MFDDIPRPTCRSVYTVSDKHLRHGGSGYEIRGGGGGGCAVRLRRGGGGGGAVAYGGGGGGGQSAYDGDVQLRKLN